MVEIKRRMVNMAYQGTKGWYIQKLKEKGITRHPTDQKKLECYKTFVVRNLYFEHYEKELG
jgi:hypothetical protein